MSKASGKRWFAGAGVILVLLGLVHVGAIFGGPAWYAFMGAPDGIVAMVRAGHRYPDLISLLITLLCLIWAAYAFSGAGLVRPLPLLRTGLVLIAGGMLARAFGFIAVLAVSPDALDAVCGCNGIDAMILITSAVCLAIGAGIAIGLYQDRKGAASMVVPVVGHL